MSEEIAQCPFCGSPDMGGVSYNIKTIFSCYGCSTNFEIQTGNMKEAIAFFNKRVLIYDHRIHLESIKNTQAT
jgi:transcription elongation factor Elf1